MGNRGIKNAESLDKTHKSRYMIHYRLGGSTTMLSSRNPVDAAHPRATTLFSYAYYASKPIISSVISRDKHDSGSTVNNN